MTYLEKPYNRVILPNEKGGYRGKILELPGCIAQGATVEQCYKNLDNAARKWILDAVAKDQPVPEPYIGYHFSGRLLLRIPRSMHAEITHRAKLEGVSLNQYLILAIQKGILYEKNR